MNAANLRIVPTLPHGFYRSGDVYVHPAGARVAVDGDRFTLLQPILVAAPESRVQKPVTLDGYAVFVDGDHEDTLGEALGKALEMWREIGVRR